MAVFEREPPLYRAPLPPLQDTKEWLKSVTDTSDSNVRATLSHRKIQRVPHFLRMNHNNIGDFDPGVIELGPFHYGDAHLKMMHEHKKAAGKYFTVDSGHSIELFYNKVRSIASEARGCYADMPEISDKEFVDMMFFDGCFILNFIDEIVGDRSQSHPTIPAHMQNFIIKDMFMLENQIPHIVLEALMTLKSVDINKFIDMIIASPIKTLSSPLNQNRDATCHLLDLLRMRILGEEEEEEEEEPFVEATWNTFRSVMELKEEGIIFKRHETKCHVRGIEFKNRVFHSYLSLPPIVVDDLTKSRFLNLIAVEMCDGFSDYGITSYVWLMDRFIDHADDVKELRSQGILLNVLGSDQQVAELFNEVSTNLSPDHDAYFAVIKGIDDHCKNTCRVSVVRMVNTHFSTPWKSIALFVAIFVIILTMIQTIYAVSSRD